MKDKTLVQDYLFSSALVLKTAALVITLYALDAYAGVVFEKNPVTRLLLGNNTLFFFAELATFTFVCFAYRRVRRKYFEAYRIKLVRWSFNAMVAFVFLTYLWDAANDVMILIGTSLPGIHG